MLLIKTIENVFNKIGRNAKGQNCCFKSSCDTVVKSDDFAQQMSDYNSTLTKADAAAALQVINDLIERNLKDGNKVILPFCTIYPYAKGNCENLYDNFTPSRDDNVFDARITLSEKIKGSIKKDVTFKMKSPVRAMQSRLYNISSVSGSGSETKLELKQKLNPGLLINLHGINLKFNYEDKEQGVFLKGKNTKSLVRISTYLRSGSRVICFYIPTSLKADMYDIQVKTSAGNGEYFYCSLLDAFEI